MDKLIENFISQHSLTKRVRNSEILEPKGQFLMIYVKRFRVVGVNYTFQKLVTANSELGLGFDDRKNLVIDKFSTFNIRIKAIPSPTERE